MIESIERDRYSAPTALEVTKLNVKFSGKSVLKDLSLIVRNREFVVLMGRSGCGKSTLLKALVGEIRISSGQVLAPKKSIGYCQQNSPLFPWMTLEQNLAIAGKGETKRIHQERARELLKIVGLLEHSSKRPYEVSGGMRTRACLARAFMSDSSLVLLDEPFAALDPITLVSLYESTLELKKTSESAVVLVTHSLNEAIQVADRIMVMNANGSGWTLDESVARHKKYNLDLRSQRNSPEIDLIQKIWEALED